MRVLIIGGTGFIGQSIVRALLDAKHEVRLFHRGSTSAESLPALPHIPGDRRELFRFTRLIEEWSPEVVLDTCAYDRDDMLALKQGIDRVHCRVIILSSLDVYRAYGIFCRLESGSPDSESFTEDAPLRTALYPYRNQASSPDDLAYRYDKIPVENFALSELDKPVTILRLGKVYGQRDPQRHAQDMLNRVRNGPLTLSLEHARWRWSRVYVENVAAATALAISDDVSLTRLYNVGEEPVLSEKEWIEAVARAAGEEAEITIQPESENAEPYEWHQHLCADTTRLRLELGWREKTKLEEALERTLKN